jgi:hypothetical protein
VASWPPGVIDQLTSLWLLRSTANAAAVVCDACCGDHVEQVTYVESPPGTALRAYIRCPEAGRVPVPLERLRCWELNFRRLADLAASALATAGNVEEVIPARVWLLGRTTLAGRPLEVFLARGLPWPDAAGAIGAAARLVASCSPVVLAAGALPPPGVWHGESPPILPLSAVLRWDDQGPAADRGYLEAAFFRGRRRPPSGPTASFPTPDGAAWEDVRITLEGQVLRVEVRGRRRDFTFQEAGFEEKRKKNVPDRLWGLLRLFALRGGVVPFAARELSRAEQDNLKQNVSALAKRLAALLHIEGRPFKSTRGMRRYEARFRISTDEGVVFPTPAGVSWNAVSIVEERAGVLAISVEATETFITHTRENDGETAGRWEVAEQEGFIRRTYDLCTLGLGDAGGRPTGPGLALLELLRAGGKLRREKEDPDLLALGGAMSRLMQIDSAPFQFSQSRQTWSAIFDASSEVGDSPR